MTTKADFDEKEWAAIADGPALAGMLVLTADRGGTVRETLALAKAYTDARRETTSPLLDAVASQGPGGVRFTSVEELREHGLRQLTLAAESLRQKATPEEFADYRRFVLDVARRVANAHREQDDAISDREQQALEEVTARLDESSPASSAG